MYNEILWICFAFFDLSLVLLAHHFLGKTGLFCMIVFNLLLCNIQVLKIVELFGITTTLGNILYASIFLSTDLLAEFYGKKEAKKAIYIGFLTLFLMTVYIQITILFKPSAFDQSQIHLTGLFSLLPRVMVASLCAFTLSQMLDIQIFHALRNYTKKKHLWLRNNVSTLTSQLLDSLVFCFIAFYGLMPFNEWLEICISTYIIKALVAVIDTPFMYFAHYLHTKKGNRTKE